MSDDVCLCGHARTAHDHYRRGTDCASCPDGECNRFRSPRSVGRLIAPLRRRFSRHDPDPPRPHADDDVTGGGSTASG